LSREALLGDDAEDFFLAHDEELFAVELDLRAGILAEQDGVASLDVQREDLALVVRFALADGDDFALLRLLLGAADEDAVVQRSKLGCHNVLLLIVDAIVDAKFTLKWAFDAVSTQTLRLLTIVCGWADVNPEQMKCE
jgi:hypothetical protein